MYSCSGKIAALVPFSTFMCLWAIYIFTPGNTEIGTRHLILDSHRAFICSVYYPFTKQVKHHSIKAIESHSLCVFALKVCREAKISHFFNPVKNKNRVHCKEKSIYVFFFWENRGQVPFSTFMCLWAIYIFLGSVHIFPSSRIGRPILEIYKSLIDIWVYGTGRQNIISLFRK